MGVQSLVPIIEMASLGLLLVSCCLLAVCQGSAPVINTHVATAVPGEYLVVLKPGTFGLATNTLNDDFVIDFFDINGWRALHVKVDDDAMFALREDANVDYIEANSREVRLFCNEQSSGRRIWGLTRTSSRAKPNFDRDTYKYGSDDGTGVDAYVIDTGINVNHVDFEGRAVHGFT